MSVQHGAVRDGQRLPAELRVRLSLPVGRAEHALSVLYRSEAGHERGCEMTTENRLWCPCVKDCPERKFGCTKSCAPWKAYEEKRRELYERRAASARRYCAMKADRRRRDHREDG